MEVRNAQQLTAETGRMLLDQGLVARTWGNVSCRVDEKRYAITPSGLDYVGMTPEDIVIMDRIAGTWEGDGKPSGERGVHSAAYQTFPEVNFVIHTHQTYATAIGLAGFETLNLTSEEKEELGGVELAGYGLPGTKKLTNNVRKALETGAKVVLMAHHGALICGSDREDAFRKAVLLEKVCEQNLKGKGTEYVGKMPFMAEQMMKKIREKYPNARLVHSFATLQLADRRIRLKAQVDDMAQMLGPYLTGTDADAERIVTALEKTEAVLVRGIGAVVKADQEEDAKALAILVEKAAICYLHTDIDKKNASLSWFDARLMRFVYKMKYSKQK